MLASVNTRRAAGGLAVDPPAVSRIHQTLSDGNLGFYQACKLEDTPLPFPYAQVVSLVLFIFAATSAAPRLHPPLRLLSISSLLFICATTPPPAPQLRRGVGQRWRAAHRLPLV